ncbi:sigma 54-interacting transcriptional regulator [Bacillus thuringiensis]|uniref:sigma 54-interacting transcriptional regulator n=4 Tax=Bacillus TaxID=1386 RepID=UPI003D6628ED
MYFYACIIMRWGLIMQRIEINIHTTNGLHVRAAATLIAKLNTTIKDTRILKKIFILYKGKKSPIMSLLSIASFKIKKGDKVIIQFEEEVSMSIIEEIKNYLEEEKVNYIEQNQTDHLLLENFIAIEEIFSSLSHGLVVVNKENLITYVNNEGGKLLGMSVEKLLNQRADLVIPHSRLHHVLQTGKEEIAQKQVVGKQVIVTNRTPIILNQNIVGAVALFQDISTVEELIEELKRVKELKKQLELILHSVKDLIALTDSKGRFIYCNPEMEGFLNSLDNPDKVQFIFGIKKWKFCIKSQKCIPQLLDFKLGNSYIAKLSPILVEEELCGTILTMSPFHETQSLFNQLIREKKRIKYLESELSKYKKLNDSFPEIIGCSDVLMETLFIANKVAKSDSTVLITGESGTGKELIAKGIHKVSLRKDKPFIRVNCAAIPPNLIESELFGHEKGAFTGALHMRRGKFEQANNGTIFLDEIGDLKLDLQVKLLRVLQEKEIVRIGGDKTIKLNVRVLAATNGNLQKMVHDREFREDLYYRLNVIPIHIPPLRERKADIQSLIEYFKGHFNTVLNKEIHSYTDDFLQALMKYNWPGNIRELQNVIERAMNLSENDVLEIGDLPDNINMNSQQNSIINNQIENTETVLTMSEYEKKILKHVIQFYPSFNAAGKALGLTHKTVAAKVRKYNLESYMGKKYQTR